MTQWLTSDGFTPQEWGRPLDSATAIKPEGQPRGEAKDVLPHPATFPGLMNASNRSYLQSHDEALLHSRENAYLLRLDPVVDACMRLLVYPVALLTSHIDPQDPNDPQQVEAASEAERKLCSLQGFMFIRRWLADCGAFVGRAGAQVRWQWQPERGRKWMMPTRFTPVHGDKLVFKWDGRVGILVSAAFQGHTEPSERGPVYYLSPEEREQFICHEVEPEDVPYHKPMMAGAVHGTGLRGKLYWLWALKQRVWGMGMDFLQWFSRGLTVYPFPGGNASYANEIADWVRAQDGSQAMLIPWYPNLGPYEPVQRFEASTASPQFIQSLITTYFDDLIRQIILGQTLTTQASPTGIGSGASAAHQTTFDIRVKYHAVALGETLSRDLLGPWYRANYPGVPVGNWVLEVDDPNVQSMIDNAERLYNMGAAIPEEALMDSAGLPEVKDGDTILTQVQPMQPAATEGLPTGMPVQQGEPVQLSLRQWSTLTRMAARGDKRAMAQLSRRCKIKGLNC